MYVASSMSGRKHPCIIVRHALCHLKEACVVLIVHGLVGRCQPRAPIPSPVCRFMFPREKAVSKKAALSLKCRQCFYRLGALVRAFRLIDPECQNPAYATGSASTVMILYLVDAREATVSTDVRALGLACIALCP